MAPAVVAHPEARTKREILLIETSVLDTIAERIERELDRVRAARPHLASRVGRAENLLVAHLSCRRQNLIKVRCTAGRPRFLVQGGRGAVYVVDPATFTCTCPDHHRRGAGCKHSIACYALSRAEGPPSFATPRVELVA